MIDNYQALTLGRFMEIDAVLRSDADELEKQVEIIAILNDLPADEVLALPLADYVRMAAQTAFLREPCKPAQIAEGWRYDNLVPTADFRKITTAQYIDFQTFSKDFPATLPELLSVFLVPEGNSYNEGYDVRKVQDKVRSLPLPDALGLSAFFFGRFLELTTDSLTSWAEDMKRAGNKTQKETIAAKIAEVRRLLQGAGVGLPM